MIQSRSGQLGASFLPSLIRDLIRDLIAFPSSFAGAALPALGVALLISSPARADVDAAAGKALAEKSCVSCHGDHGNPILPTTPILAGQTARYMYLELKDFKAGRRHDPVMSAMAAPLSPEDMLNVSEYFAEQPPVEVNFKTDRARVLAGAKKADETLCTMCHLGGLKGQNEIPRLAGQQPQYIMKQLQDFKSRTRTNDAGNMTSVAQTLSDDDIVNLTHYIADLQ